MIHRRGPWRSFEAVEQATLEWVDWFDNRRLLEPIGNVPPAEAEARCYAGLEEPASAARLKSNSLRRTRGGSVWSYPVAMTSAALIGFPYREDRRSGRHVSRRWDFFPPAIEKSIMMPGPPRTVLIVDDDPIYRELMTSFLTARAVARILTATNGSEAKQYVAAHGREIDLILCDLNMPDFDGVEYIMYLAEHRLACALIIISGADERVANAAGRLSSNLGLDLKGSLKKPVDFKQLDAILTAMAHAP